MTDRIIVQNKHFEVTDGTSRHLYEPAYVEPLVRAHWAGSPGEIRVRAIDPTNRYTGHLATRVLPAETEDGQPVWRAEMARLRAKFAKHPGTGTPLFDLVYNELTFKAAFDRTVLGTTAAAPAEEKKDRSVQELIDLEHVGKALAWAIRDEFGVYTPAELIATVRVSDLTKIKGIGREKAALIYDAAVTATHGVDAEDPLVPTGNDSPEADALVPADAAGADDVIEDGEAE